MIQEKTIIKIKSVIMFFIIVLFCIFVIFACSGDLPTNSTDDISNGNNTVKFKTNLPLFGKNNPYTNDNATNTPTPEPDNTIKPSQDYPSDTYRDITWFGGGGRVSYKDKEYLSYLWTNMIKDFYIIDQCYNGGGSKEKLKFKPNGDIYWEKKPDTIIKKFQGGTMIIYRAGEPQYYYGVSGVYTSEISRDEASKLGSEAVKKWFNFIGRSRYSFPKPYDNGGKKGTVEVLALNFFYSWEGFTWYGLDCYGKRNDNSMDRYFGPKVKSPEENMKTIEIDWKLWDEGIDLWFMKY